MAWQSLSTTLNSKPRVLAGPLLRKVTPTEVTVWLALRKPGFVTLKVFYGTTLALQGRRHTIAVGLNLHIVAVTANPLPHSGLSEGVIYSYDLLFEFDDGLSQGLATATANASLAYAPYTQPTFCLPPSNLNQLRLIHGSCRLPHGEGDDAFPLLDDLIAQAASNPMARPHQLLLTGDQIYADDVSDAMSLMLSDAGAALLGWTEEFICNKPTPGTRRSVMELYPRLRLLLLKYEVGFTSMDIRCHLIGLGEYLAMYLFVWSDVLWPSGAATIPTFDEIAAVFQARADAEAASGTFVGLEPSRRGAVTTHGSSLQQFAAALPKVRRMLANIPSYMIFDDHEVADDWNMTRAICRSMYGHPLGLRVVQNGLVAYALCQHWGNAPEQFEGAGQAPPGLSLLQMLDGGGAAQYESNSPGLRTRVGVHDDTVLATRPDNALFHDANALNYHYTVEGPSHQVIFTDTRTWRSYPKGNAGSVLLPAAQLQQQIVNTPATGDRALLVVLSTNVPPVGPIREASRRTWLSPRLAHNPDIYEAWEMPAAATDRLFKAISDKLPLVGLGGVRRGRAMILSGDVHHSFASRLLLQGTARFEDPAASPQPVRAVFAQLVASSFKKQDANTSGFHRRGYYYAPEFTGWLMPVLQPEGYAGWNVRSPQLIARKHDTNAWFSSPVPIYADSPKTISMNLEPGVIVNPVLPPDYRYRLDYLTATNQGFLPPLLPPIPPIPPGAGAAQRQQAARAFHAATGSYRVYNEANATTRQVVGLNNLAEITFDWGQNDNNKSVNHTLRWVDPRTSLVKFTTYTVLLNPDASVNPADPL